MQIHIIGNVCSGKTFIAKKLAEKIGLKHVELDKIVFKADHSKKSEEEVARGIAEVVGMRDRVSDGGFSEEGWVDELLRNTEKVYLLRVGILRNLGRVVKRNFEFRKSGRAESFGHFVKMIRYVLKGAAIYEGYAKYLKKLGVEYKIVGSLEEILKDLG